MRRRDSSAQPKPRDLAILLFALPMLVYLLSGPVFYGYDGEIMYRVSESLVLRHSIVITDPIYHYTHVFLLQPSVTGWYPTLLDHHPYKHVWLEP